MRLSEVLSKAPDTSKAQVEGFLGYRRIGWGQHRSISVGKIIRNYFCLTCHQLRTYVSSDKLSCLVTGESSISVDATLRCSICDATAESWFLVGCDDNLFSQAPTVYLERYTENWRDAANVNDGAVRHIDDLLERAQIAYDSRLGAGAMIYLRQVFETITSEVAGAVGIPTEKSNGGRKSFKTLLTEVDTVRHIIPSEFSSNGYKLFIELSEVIHGRSNELEALTKYSPCRKLVLGIIRNVQNHREMAKAIASLGWDESIGTELTTLRGGAA